MFDVTAAMDSMYYKGKADACTEMANALDKFPEFTAVAVALRKMTLSYMKHRESLLTKFILSKSF
jgi:hypothetical protein